jgi:general stress protein 26
MPVEITNFAEIEDEFHRRVRDAVYANVASVDAQNRPRSRVLHPLWEGKTGWILTWPMSHKSKHLAKNPYVSLAYLKNPIEPVYVDCKAEWENDANEKRRIWDLFSNTPPPVGYDPSVAFESVDNPKFGVLKLIPWRIQIYRLEPVNESLIWHA